MVSYKTLKEKADEWDISSRHLQYLCKKGSIDGAIKRAGAWFIPDSAPIPVKYMKTGDRRLHFVGTRKKIFDCAIELFKSRGFEGVSIKDIADTVGITQSSMYNHFKSKNEILDTIYDYYCRYYSKDRPGFEEIEPILRSGSLVDIIESVTYSFGNDYEKRMADISVIVFHRYAIDDRAREIMKSLMIDEGVRFVEAVFERAVEIGRLAPMDTHAMAVLINSVKIYKLHSWLAAPAVENLAQLNQDEAKLFQYASRLLTDLKSPDDANP